MCWHFPRLQQVSGAGVAWGHQYSKEGILHFILVHASFVLEVTTVFTLGSEGLYPPQSDSSREQRPPRSDMKTLEVRMSP